jgi:hypothetical protein
MQGEDSAWLLDCILFRSNCLRIDLIVGTNKYLIILLFSDKERFSLLLLLNSFYYKEFNLLISDPLCMSLVEQVYIIF